MESRTADNNKYEVLSFQSTMWIPGKCYWYYEIFEFESYKNNAGGYSDVMPSGHINPLNTFHIHK